MCVVAAVSTGLLFTLGYLCAFAASWLGCGHVAGGGEEDWIIKNSWSDKWKDHGFVYLAKGVACGNLFSAGAHVYTYGPEQYYYEL
jgi:hypothetical protein